MSGIGFASDFNKKKTFSPIPLSLCSTVLLSVELVMVSRKWCVSHKALESKQPDNNNLHRL